MLFKGSHCLAVSLLLSSSLDLWRESEGKMKITCLFSSLQSHTHIHHLLIISRWKKCLNCFHFCNVPFARFRFGVTSLFFLSCHYSYRVGNARKRAQYVVVLSIIVAVYIVVIILKRISSHFTRCWRWASVLIHFHTFKTILMAQAQN